MLKIRMFYIRIKNNRYHLQYYTLVKLIKNVIGDSKIIMDNPFIKDIHIHSISEVNIIHTKSMKHRHKTKYD